jgi:glycosyltransferase involved in cell wall biosynthesis
MNILFAFTLPIVPHDGGVQRVTDILAKELISRGHNVVFVSYKYNAPLPDYDYAAPQLNVCLNNRDGGEISAEVSGIIEKYNIEFVVAQVVAPDFLRYVPSTVKRVCVCHMQPYYCDDMQRSRVWQTRPTTVKQFWLKCASLISPKVWEIFRERIDNRAYRDTLPLVDMCCFLSERYYPRVLRHLPGFPREKMCAVNNPNSFDVASLPLVTHRDNVILCVSRMENAQKNVIGFIKAWQILAPEFPDWRAVLVGDGADLIYNRRYAERHNIRNIEFVGPRSNVVDYYLTAKFVAVPSFWESWCMVLTEAMACGCVPCVYDTYETLHDIVDDGVTGLICRPTPVDMASRLRELMTNETERERIAMAAQHKVETFRVSVIADRWETLLKSI